MNDTQQASRRRLLPAWLSMVASVAWFFVGGFHHQTCGQDASSEPGRGDNRSNPSGAVLRNRYSFNEKSGDRCHDSVGGRDGTLMNGASFDGAGQVVLDNKPGTFSGPGSKPQHIALPVGLIADLEAVTLEIWVTPRPDYQISHANWARLWDFGDQTFGSDHSTIGRGAYFFSCIGDASATPAVNAHITSSGGDDWCTSAATLLSGRANHWVWTADPVKHIQHLYLNGVVVGTSRRFVNPPVLAGPTTNNWLGRSQFSQDPALNGSIDEFRIYRGALSPFEVAANFQSGPDLGPASYGKVIGLHLRVTNLIQVGSVASSAVYAKASGLTNQLNVTLNPELPISFSSVEPSVATVDATGNVFGLSAGKVSIIASAFGLSATSVVQVVVPAPGQSLGATATAAPSDSLGVSPRNRPRVRLALDSAQTVASGRFLPGPEAQEVRLTAPVTSRYFCLESLSAYGGQSYASVAEIDLLDDAGRPLDRTGWTVAYADSEERDGENGKAENAIDGEAETFWHTQWQKAAPTHPHYLVLDLGRSRAFAGFRYLPRPGDKDANGRIEEYRIYAGDELVRANPQESAFPSRGYLFAYFQKVGADGLHLAYSLNGYRWEVMGGGNSFLRPQIGPERLLRDPFLFRDQDGMFRLVWTMGWWGSAIGYASSTDLLHWSEQRAIPVMADEPGTRNCWAPEIFWDARSEQYELFWASTVANGPGGQSRNRIYATTTKDFNTFTRTRLLYDSGSGANDPTLVSAKGQYYLWFRKEPDNRLTVVTSDNPLGPFDNPRSPSIPAKIEGPMIFRLGNQYALGCHFIEQSRFGVFASPDLEHWEDISSATSFPPGAGQGSIVEVPGEVLRGLAEAGHLDLGTTPEAATLGVGDWIWTTNVTDKQTCRLWRRFSIPNGSGVAHAILRITADDSYIVYLDGKEVGHGADANCLTDYDVTWLLSPGYHVVAVEAFNEEFTAGVLLGLRINLTDGKLLEVLSDSSWRVADSHAPGWKTSRQPQPSWTQAQVVGYAGKAWWQHPRKIFETPPLLPPAHHFWQQTWFLSLILGVSALGAVFTVRQALQLAVQTRSNRLLEGLVAQRTQELRRSQEHLEEQVTQRTTELKQANELLQQDIAKREQAEAALLHARGELERVSRVTTMGEFAASIAHEVNQPLAGVVTSANAGLNWMANNPPDLVKTREAMLRILRDGTRAGEVLNRIRALFKRTGPVRSLVSVNEVMRDVVALAGGELRQQNVGLSLELNHHLPAILGDSIQLQQVLLNLVKNSVEAMAGNGTRPKLLRIASAPGDLGGNPAVSVKVSDTGIGFDATDPERLFEAFHTTKPQGMGMGLWISRSIVESHGGRLTAQSNGGPGATFEILLPAETGVSK